jgi:hypothetical protein
MIRRRSRSNSPSNITPAAALTGRSSPRRSILSVGAVLTEASVGRTETPAIPLLHWSPRSPYLRKVMIALHEKGRIDQVSTVRTHVDPMISLEGFMDINPLSKIPTLELEDGTVLFDSHVICLRCPQICRRFAW